MYISTQPQTTDISLAPENEEIIKATLPIVGGAIEDITPVFYRTMFKKHPELLSDLFNRGNQRSGEQQKALAASIATFASMLVNPDAPDPREMLSRIGHKHVSLGITEDQYQIVHDNLFAAIVEVLGEDVVTPEVAAAWDEVYWLMAKVLIDFERNLYRSADVADGDVFRTVTLQEKKQLSHNVVEFTFNGVNFSDALPGQYVSIGVELSDGARQLRQYSIVGTTEETFTVAVQRDGEVSSFLMDELETGSQVEATLPAGDLVLQDDDAPVILVSQGIGSTPMAGMLAALVARSATGGVPSVTAIHADAAPETYAQRDITESQVSALAENGEARHIVRYRDNGETVELAKMAEEGLIPQGAHWYLCGGSNFLQNLRDQLAEHSDALSPKEIHFELFSPNDWLI
ncbi:FAD-binding oxidoreductase [Corynebacterium macclintockiae]|uniref:globin domain-containing protein n=1 Tax=Corynebacterium macclintockiae TaxID=2913501 RepID=UPI00255154DF|nr:globin domain-containing protein [Corynebacterium macclintockiae]MDK8891479.1 FAD-binding oxidoreductase [Corynebacterium macclintockiae]